MEHLHGTNDTDTHFSIDPITRAIRNETPKSRLVQHDHNSERFTFEMPRYIEGHDMSLCNKVEVHYANIRGYEKNEGVYEIGDWRINPDDDSVVVGSWLISANATRLSGSLNFLIRFACIADDGTIDYAWHTEIFDGIPVSKGMDNGEAVTAIYPDVLEAWKREIMAEIFNDYENNDSNIPCAHITGRNNKAVVRCFLIKGFTANSITLDSVEGIEIGMPWNIFCIDEEEGYDKHRGVILSVDSTTNSVTLFTDGIQLTDIDEWGIVPSSEPTFLNTFICNGGTIGTDTINDVDFAYFSVTMSGENNIGYINARVHGTSNKGLAFNAVIDGYKCEVRGERGVALNYRTKANGDESFAINMNTEANGKASLSQGEKTKANGYASSSFGMGTVASGKASMARGAYNTIDEEGKYLDMVGNGTSDSDRSNAYTLDKEGNGNFSGSVRMRNLYLRDEAEPYAGLRYRGTLSNMPVQDALVGDAYKLTKDTTMTINKYSVTSFGNRKLKPEDGVIMSDSYKDFWFPNSMVHYEDLIKILDGSYEGFKICNGTSPKINPVDITFKKPRKLFIYLFDGTKEIILKARITGVKVDTENQDIKFFGEWVDDCGIEADLHVTSSYYCWFYTDNVYHNISELYNSTGGNISTMIINANRFPDGNATNEILKEEGSAISFSKGSMIFRSEDDGWMALGGYTTVGQVQTLIANALDSISNGDEVAY